MTTYHERRYKNSPRHKHHMRRRRHQKAKTLFSVLGVMCAILAAGMLVLVAFGDTPAERNQWWAVTGVYLAGSVVLLIMRAILDKRGQ